MTIGDMPSPSQFSVELGNAKVEKVRPVSSPTLQLEVVETRQVSAVGDLVNPKQPTPRAQSDEITITRGADRNREFTDWINRCLKDGSLKAARKNVTIVQHGADKKPVMRYKLNNAWASAANGADPRSTDATDQVTLTYEDCTVERA
ncbi:phage tail protein [Streptomyces subrutilus]|uniref:phage tail protein n=1 Tax=Streptomyces subrutilus TaxID=36818 RepID=UPI00343CB955